MYKTKSESNKLGKLPANEMRISDLFIALSKALDLGKIQILDLSRRVNNCM